MRFESPWFLSLFLLLPLWLWLGPSKNARVLFSSLSVFSSFASGPKVNPRKILRCIRLLALVSIILALARPQSGRHYSEIDSEGVDIFLALDTSGSMQALDFELNGKRGTRLDAVKNVVEAFIKKRPSDRIGLVVFGEEAFTQCPLTLDHQILLNFIDRMEIGMAGDATSIGAALGVASKRMRNLKSKSKIVVLVTDGKNTAGRIDPLKAADIAKSYGIKVYTIGVGQEGRAPFLVDTVFGKQVIYQQVELDEKTLTSIADITGAKYYRATDTKELENIYEDINQLEKTEVKTKTYTEYDDLFHWILAMGLFFLFLEIFLTHTFLRVLPLG
ncbi:MAG: VWA domain-containing protein [Bdellovibrionales bacterium]|nr:VWA domain-containing protein [Bdellovibrionales bacterium]